jgi:TctA family transporter
MALALMTTLTLKLPPNQALLILICTYVGSIYGGSRSAILLNIPAHRRRPRLAWTAMRWRARAWRDGPWASPPRARCWAR